MDILLFYDVIISYFKNFNNVLNKNETQYVRSNIIENPQNKIVLSYQYIKFIIDLVEDKEKKLSSFLPILAEWINSSQNRIIKLEYDSGNDLCNEFSKLYNNYQGDLILTFTDSYNQCVLRKNNFNAVSLTDISKTNKNWVYSELASKQLCNVSCFDFQNDEEIENFLESIYDIPKNLNEIIIFDNFVKINDHKIFEYFSIRSVMVTYYSTSKRDGMDLNLTSLNEINDNLKKKFGDECKFLISHINSVTHPRYIILNNILMEFTHDFSFIKSKNQNWHIYVSYDKSKIENVLNLKKYYYDYNKKRR